MTQHPIIRPRRLRSTPARRRLVSEVRLDPGDLQQFGDDAFMHRRILPQVERGEVEAERLDRADQPPERAARGAGAGLSGRLRVSAATTFARLHVVPMLPPAQIIELADQLAEMGRLAREVGRQAVMADPDWQSGRYIEGGVRPHKGLAVARMAAHVTYLSEAALQRKFGRNLQDRESLGFGFEADALGVGFGATTARGASDDSTFLSSDSPEIAPMRFKSSRRSASVSLAALPSCFSANFRTSSRLCWSSPICFCRRLIAFFSPMPSALRRRRLQDPRTRG